ncbi:MAG TPA: hypothetical protein VFN55_17330 [Solirubrobacteraceae bacterium]|nr:hypothetical protein [Solirubrobacteraceae bacterium]
MSLLGGGGRSLEGPDRDTRPVRGHIDLRPQVRSTLLGAGTVACPACDAPVSVGPGSRGIRDRLRCPYCDHRGPLRDFLSLAAPSRPARVTVHVTAPLVPGRRGPRP